jgi:hypothetical protein
MEDKQRKMPSEAQKRMIELLGPLEGAKIPGGCDTCDAYQMAEPLETGVWYIRVYHDEDCPTHGG